MTYASDSSYIDDIVAVFNEVEMSVSPFNGQSLVSAVNRGDSVVADAHLSALIEGSRRVCELSGGAFDPTLAPLINLWGFGYDNGGEDVTDDDISHALEAVGIMECGVGDDGIIYRKSPDTQFNFSAIAKGYGCDCVAAALKARGVEDYMVEVGGEVVVAGHSPRGTLWNIQVDAPEVDNLDSHKALTVIALTDCGVATSGNYRNYHVDAGGRRYGHTISAVSGRPVVSDMLSATVVAPTAMEADALATACMAMTPDDAMTMIESVDRVECLLVVAAGDSSGYDIRVSKGWSAFAAE